MIPQLLAFANFRVQCAKMTQLKTNLQKDIYKMFAKK